MTYNISDIMKEAWEYRRDGASMSDALKEAWKDAKNDLLSLIATKVELEEQLKLINDMIKNHKDYTEDDENNNEVEIDFDSGECQKRIGIPYVARISINNNKLDREFITLEKEYGKDYNRAFGSFTAKENEIFELRTSNTKNNYYRYFVSVKNGNLEFLATCDEKKKVYDFFKSLENKKEGE